MLRNSLFINYVACNRPHSLVSSNTSFLEGVSFIFNQICKKCTKLGKNIIFLVLFPAEKCTKIKLFAKSVLKSYRKINTYKYFIIHKPIFFIDRLLTETVSSLSFLFSKQGKAYKEGKKYINNFKGVNNVKNEIISK